MGEVRLDADQWAELKRRSKRLSQRKDRYRVERDTARREAAQMRGERDAAREYIAAMHGKKHAIDADTVQNDRNLQV